MNLVHDLLDEQVVDRHGRELGRVDAVVIEIRDEAPPRVTAIEIGPAVLAFRICPLFGRIMSGVERTLGIDDRRPFRIPFSDILEIDARIVVDRAAGETPAWTVEHWLRRWVSTLPGSS